MSYYDYIIGREIALLGGLFYAIIQAAMRQADTDNLDKLKIVFPDVYVDLYNRYNSQGGRYEGEEML